MRNRFPGIIVPAALFLTANTLLAADPNPIVQTWRAQTLLQAVGNVLIFALIGIVAAIVGFKLFDRFTPGHLGREIVEHRNVAAGIVAGAVILGVCIVIAAAMIG